MIYSFDGYEVDPDRIELRHDGTPVHVEPQVFDLTCYLIEHRDRVVSKIELFEEIWGGAFVGESTLTSRIKSARRALGDDGRAQRVIRTVHRRGYQFVADVLERIDGDTPRGPDPSGAARPPSGTVTFLFSDIEGSSRWWEEQPELMPSVIGRHDEILNRAVADHGGVVFATAGDGVAAAFPRASAAVAAARHIRSALDDEPWPEPVELAVRLGAHTGEAVERDGDYLGAAVNRAARVMAAARGGQTLISDVTAGLLDDDAGLSDLGICEIDPAMASVRLWQVDGPAFPPPTGAIAVSLPALRTEVIGREVDLERVGDAVVQHRVVSIVGPGGAGKTTLALAAASSLLVSFPAGVVFVELASVDDGGGIERAVAETAGVEGAAASSPGALTAHLARRPMLLVLDNCEHLLDECADFIDAVLDAGVEATVLTTSREPTGVDGEVVVHLGSLAAGAPELFLARARAADAAVAGGLERDDPRIEHLCRRLDGLPLAIELAAAQLQHLGLDELIERLDASLAMSRGGRSRGRERHVTLDRTIAWSYDLLDERGRWLIRQLGVFPGSFDLAAAEAVGRRPDSTPDATPVFATLSELLSKSLMIRDTTSGRYRLLETIRAFASQRLAAAGEVDAAAERLRCHVVERATATSRVDRWFSGDNGAALRADLDNVRVAFDRSMSSGEVIDALEIHVACSYLYRNTISSTDGRRWDALLEPAESELGTMDRLWWVFARADLAQGTADHELGQRSAARALELVADLDDVAARVIARQYGALHHVVSAPDVARARLSDARELAGGCGDRRLERLVRAFLAVTEMAAGEVDLGMRLAEEVGHDVTGDGYDVFIANWAAWTGCLIRGDAPRLRYWRERQRGYLSRVGIPEPWMFLWSTALVAAMEGDDATDGLRAARERADGEGHDIAADIVLALAVVERLARRPVDAAELLGVVIRRRLNNLSHYVLRRTLRAALRDELGDAALGAAIERGAGRDPATVLDERGIGTR